MPAQKDMDDLWSHVYTIHARTCFRFGAVSSISNESAQLLLLEASALKYGVHTYARSFSDVDRKICLRLTHIQVPIPAMTSSVRHLVGRRIVVLVVNGPAEPAEDTSASSKCQSAYGNSKL